MRSAVVFGLVGLCLPLTAGAQSTQPTPRALSLRECIDLALRHNLDVQIERYGPDIERFYLKGAYGAYEPVFNFRAERMFLDQPGSFDPKKSGVDFPYELTTDSVGPGLSGRLPSGLTYDLTARSDFFDARTDFSSDPARLNDFPPRGIRYTNQYFATAGITLRQPLLKDFWIDSNRQKILVNKKNLKISEMTLRWQLMHTVTAVQLAYYDLIFAHEKVKDEEQFLEMARQLFGETKRRVQVGDLPQLDEKQAESQVETRQSDLFAAQQDLAEKQNALRILLTDDFKAWVDVDLRPAEGLVAVEEPFNRDESWQNALRQRPDLLRVRAELEKQSINVRYLHNQLFPSLDLVGSYGARGAQHAFEDAVGDVGDGQHPAHSFGVVLSVPLGNRTARNNYNASQAQKKQAELFVKKAEQNILAQVDNAMKLAQSVFRRVKSTHLARVFADDALKAERKKLENGISTTFIVLEYLQRLADARAAEIRALADYNKAVAQFALSEGATLEKNQLTLEVR